jgi:hypothetical protein
MIVYSDYECARKDIVKVSQKLKKELVITFSVFDCRPRRVEFYIKSSDEVIDLSHVMCIKRLYKDSVDDLLTIQELLVLYPDYIPFIKSRYKCGDLAEYGAKNFAPIDTLPLKTLTF